MALDYPPFRDAPAEWALSRDASISTLHQLSPYIGKLKPRIAQDLILAYTRPGDCVVDPFCGSGSIPLEALLNGRSVVASDSNPYAFVLTKAKLDAPANEQAAQQELEEVLSASHRRRKPNLAHVPLWVKRFFHPQTLHEAIRFADECIERKSCFLLACFLGILHHQRPGFLSFPSSHLVPYLRDKKFPVEEFPEMYEYREIFSRMRAKIARSFKTPGNFVNSVARVQRCDIRKLSLPETFDAIVTSPPYMNALDYCRDNRLRMWFLDRETKDYFAEPTDRKSGLEEMVRSLVSLAETSLKPKGRIVLVIGESVLRRRQLSHPSSSYIAALQSTSDFSLVDAVRDDIPDIRRARRDYAGTKAEHILVFEKRASRSLPPPRARPSPKRGAKTMNPL